MALVCVYVRKANYFQQGKNFLSQGSNLDFMLNLYNNSIIDSVNYRLAMLYNKEKLSSG